MISYIVFIRLVVRSPSEVHESHVWNHGRSSIVSYFWLSSVTIFPTCRRKGVISSSPLTRGVDLGIRRGLIWRWGVASGASCDAGVGFGLVGGCLVVEFAIFKCLRGYYTEIKKMECTVEVYGSYVSVVNTGLVEQFSLFYIDRSDVICFTYLSKGSCKWCWLYRTVAHFVLKALVIT